MFEQQAKQFLRKHLLTMVFIGMAVSAFLVIIYLRFEAYRAWRYTSDLFSFYSAMRETARGNIGLEFIYGNAFGDHGYFFLILMSPLYLLFKAKSIYFLLAAAAVSYLISAIALYFTLKRFTKPTVAFLLGMIYVLGYRYIFQGLFEDIYGMHPETVSGFILVLITCIFLLSCPPRLPAVRIGIPLLFIFYVSLKEEMALLAVLYLAIIYWMTKEKGYLSGLIIAAIFVIIDFSLIAYFRTPYNRTNAILFQQVLEYHKNASLFEHFVITLSPRDEFIAYWLFVLISIPAFMFLTKLTVKKQPFIIALYACGISKMLFSYVTFDFNLLQWHNLSGVVMCVAALILSLAFLPSEWEKQLYISSMLLVIIAVVTFIRFDIPHIYWTHSKSIDFINRISAYTIDLDRIRQRVDPMRIVAIQGFSTRAWIYHRFTSYPIGVDSRPIGIADYAVLPLGDAKVFWRGLIPQNDTEVVSPSFVETDRNEYFVLYTRTSLTAEERKVRNSFLKFGIPEELPETSN